MQCKIQSDAITLTTHTVQQYSAYIKVLTILMFFITSYKHKINVWKYSSSFSVLFLSKTLGTLNRNSDQVIKVTNKNRCHLTLGKNNRTQWFHYWYELDAVWVSTGLSSIKSYHIIRVTWLSRSNCQTVKISSLSINLSNCRLIRIKIFAK